MNKILVLGNGFDLAHYLPTKYDHFMTAMQAIVKSQNREIAFDELFADYLKNNDEFFLRTKEFYKTDEFKLSEILVNNFKEKLENNAWFQYFSKYLENVETWIDFESEIERVLWLFLEIINLSYNSNNLLYSNIQEYPVNDIFMEWKKISLNFTEKHKLSSQYNDLLKVFILKVKYISGVYERYSYSQSKDFRELREIDIDEFSNNITEKFIRKDVFNGCSVYEYYDKRKVINTIDIGLLKRYGQTYTSLNGVEIFKILSNQLNDFKSIFSLYMLEVVEKLNPKKEFKIPNNLDVGLSAVFTFNYSESFQRFYGIKPNLIDKVQHLHGNAKANNIVLGIDDLNDELKPYKIYDFVKTHQKIINNTDYKFLNYDILKLGYTNPNKMYLDTRYMKNYHPYEIIVWGHSLDISDREYIQEIFSFNQDVSSPKIFLTIWNRGTPHTSLANLIHIMGKDIVQNWVKKGWLKFEKMPDIYALNKSDENEN